MKVNNQKRLAAQLLKCSEKRIRFDPDKLSDIKEAITKIDIRGLINDKVIYCEMKRISQLFRGVQKCGYVGVITGIRST